MMGPQMRFATGMALILGACLATWASAIETDFQVRPEMLEPVGNSYEAAVPDTLDLAERARLSVHGPTSFVNEKKHYEPYGHARFIAAHAQRADHADLLLAGNLWQGRAERRGGLGNRHSLQSVAGHVRQIGVA